MLITDAKKLLFVVVVIALNVNAPYLAKGPGWKQVLKLSQAILIRVVYNFDCIIAVIE